MPSKGPQNNSTKKNKTAKDHGIINTHIEKDQIAKESGAMNTVINAQSKDVNPLNSSSISVSWQRIRSIFDPFHADGAEEGEMVELAVIGTVVITLITLIYLHYSIENTPKEVKYKRLFSISDSPRCTYFLLTAILLTKNVFCLILFLLLEASPHQQ